MNVSLLVLSNAKAWPKTADCYFCADSEGNSGEFCGIDLYMCLLRF